MGGGVVGEDVVGELGSTTYRLEKGGEEGDAIIPRQRRSPEGIKGKRRIRVRSQPIRTETHPPKKPGA